MNKTHTELEKIIQLHKFLQTNLRRSFNKLMTLDFGSGFQFVLSVFSMEASQPSGESAASGTEESGWKSRFAVFWLSAT